ncbi:MAG: sigma 54-interacting transcriptional regulator [Deltaproteobacteria bacterium]|nr:sigma 54-interacting transcriptional regulator [Deltaproteobacteria bacterium]
MSRRNNEKEVALSVLREGRESVVLKIEKSEVKIGSSLLCDISLPQSGLEEFHFELIDNGEPYILRPSEGCLITLNNKAIKTEVPLRDGDLLAAGNLSFVFSLKVSDKRGSTALLCEEEEGKGIDRAFLILKSAQEERVFELIKGKKTILGSGKDSDIRISDRFVSDRHCTIFFEKSTCFIRDNLSKNGTFVNGVRTRESEIKNGSVIRLGKTELIFRAEEKNTHLETDDTNEFCGLIGFSTRMKELFAVIRKVAPTEVPVLITGESGTGKELVARAIFKNSLRADRIFIPLNCSSIARDVIESELFGHIKGSFTGAVANRKGIFEEATDGTVFLDEIGDMPLELQAKILRTIEYGEIRPVGSNRPISVGTRIISATNKNLEEASRNEQFREDLYYRLGVVHLHIPSLRERREDIVQIAEAFLRRFAPSRGLSFTTAAKEKLLSYNWPGNVRELKNVIIRSILFATKENIDESSIVFQATGLRDYMKYADRFIRVKPLSEVEKEIIQNAMNIYNGDLEKVSEKLGLNLSDLKEKIRIYGR